MRIGPRTGFVDGRSPESPLPITGDGPGAAGVGLAGYYADGPGSGGGRGDIARMVFRVGPGISGLALLAEVPFADRGDS